MLASYTQELQALKAELHNTLARLSEASSTTSRAIQTDADYPYSTPAEHRHGRSPYPFGTATTVSITPAWSAVTATTTPHSTRTITTTQRRRERRGRTNAPTRQLLQELTAAAQRRRQLEAELANEMKREEDELLIGAQHQRQQRRQQQQREWQDAIAALQRQRAEIIRQMEREAALEFERTTNEQQYSNIGDEESQETDTQGNQSQYDSHAALEEALMSSHTSQQPDHNTSATAVTTSDNQYAIGGVVTLEPLSSAECSTHQSRRHLLHQAPHSNPQSLPTMHREFYPRSHDTLNDVFNIQLKFAETMLKLEKSVQMRDQLLHAPSISIRYRTRQSRRNSNLAELDSDSSLDQGVMSDIDSLESSLTSNDDYVTPRPQCRTREPEVPTKSDSTPSSTESAATPNTRTSTDEPSSPRSEPSPTSADDIDRTPASQQNGLSTETKPSSYETTPSTGNSNKSNSITKQVRFGEGEYSTPLIARKFSFENQSDDDEESLLSFLNDPSVSSTDLNDESLMRAFDKFRVELKSTKWYGSPKMSESSFAAVRALLTAKEALLTTPVKTKKLIAVDPITPMKISRLTSTKAKKPEQHDEDQQKETITEPVANVVETDQATPDQPLDRAQLENRRRQLCLDIQAESAQLVLGFSSRNAHQTSRIKQNLIELRAQLQTIDEQLRKVNN